jgi:hypothetical protein
MMELLTFLVSDYANITQGGKLNVMGVFRDIYATNFPAIHPSMTLAIKLGVDLENHEDKKLLTIKLIDVNAIEIVKLAKEFEIPNPVKSKISEVNAIIELHDVVFPSPGRYQFTLLIDDEIKGNLDIDLIKIEKEF